MSNWINHPTVWTAEQIAVLRALRRAKVPNPSIAATLGKSRGAIAGKICRLGLPLLNDRNAHHARRPRDQRYHQQCAAVL
jgi:hypothetical protein